MTIKFKNKIMLISVFLCLFVFSGCYNTAVGISNAEGAKTFYEKELEDGNVYITSDSYTIPASSTIYIVGVTGDKDISMYQRRIEVVSQFDIHLDIALYEDATYTGGTLVESFNKNRNLGDNSTFDVYSSPTTVNLTGSTLLPFSNELKGDKKASLSSSEFADYVMKKNTTYVLEVVNQNPQVLDAKFTWNSIEQ
jgi:hypothetical protein